MTYWEQLTSLLEETDRLHRRKLLSSMVGPEYFEPGMMEYLDQSEGIYEPETGKLLLRFDSRGTRYEGRTEFIEKVHSGDEILITRDPENPYNSNNFTMCTRKGKNVGHMPAELCNTIAPLYDTGMLSIDNACVSFVDPISKRSRHAKQAILFVEMNCTVKSP